MGQTCSTSPPTHINHGRRDSPQGRQGPQGEEGCQACRPPPVRQHDRGRHQGPQGQEGILPPGHPQVRRRQQQGGRRRQGRRPCEACPEEAGCCQEGGACCCCWQEGSWLIQAARQGACQEACCQEGSQEVNYFLIAFHQITFYQPFSRLPLPIISVKHE